MISTQTQWQENQADVYNGSKENEAHFQALCIPPELQIIATRLSSKYNRNSSTIAPKCKEEKDLKLREKPNLAKKTIVSSSVSHLTSTSLNLGHTSLKRISG